MERCISLGDREAQAQVKGIVSRSGITLINMEESSHVASGRIFGGCICGIQKAWFFC